MGMLTKISLFALAGALLACGDYVQIGPVKVPTNDAQTPTPSMSFHDLKATDINGKEVSMAQYAGQKIMVVNTASECGFTPQYRQLQELYTQYKDKGLVIIGFPSNDFGGQEPGTEAEIATFCEKNYGVTFPMMSKVHAKGPEQSPVYAWLTKKSLNGKMDSEVKWNFQKYLINADGTLHTMLAHGTDPLSEPVFNWLDGK